MKRFALIIICSLMFISTSVELAESKKEKNCLHCHKDYFDRLKGKFNHKPFSEKKCEKCHKFHEFNQVAVLKDSVRNVCTKCHLEIGKISESDFHDPLIDIDSCLNCHTPPGSSNENFLKQDSPHIRI